MPKDRPHEIPWIPELAGDYDLIRELGRGGTAVVYLARDRELGRDVAIKLIRPAYVRDEDAVARLVREARTVGKLQHPSIVMLLGTRRLGDQGLALILQYVPGTTLKERIQTGEPLSFRRVEQILRDLGGALAYAHSHRIVHRDIKPENVYLDDVSGLARLADFGLARGWDSDSGLTMPGTAIGTPTYMSPEQIEGRDLDGRADLYSLGLVGYEMVTGQQPWAGESLYSIISKQKHEDLPAIATLRPDTPEPLITAIEGALRKDPADRWRNAHEFLSALAGKTSAAPRTSPEASASPALPPSETAPATQAIQGAALPRTKGSGSPQTVPPASAPLETAAPQRSRIGRWAIAAAALLVVGAFGTAIAAPESRIAGILASMASLAANPGNVMEGGDPGSTGNAGLSQGARSAEGGSAAGLPPDTRGIEPGAPGLPPSGAPPPIPSGATHVLVVPDGNDQTGVYGLALPQPIEIQAIGRDGLGMAGVTVSLEVLAGNGIVEPERGETGPDGSLLITWTLGDSSPSQLIRARTEGDPPSEVILRAEARTAAPRVAEVVRGTNQEGQVGTGLPTPLELRVLDATGNPFPGASVRFLVSSGAGRVEPAEVTTDADGLAGTIWTLGPESGPQEVIAEIAGIPEGGVTFLATATVPTVAISPSAVVGGTHSCSLRADGELVCWGANDRGQLGDGSRAGRLTPSLAVQGSRFARVASGLSHVCALSLDGIASCWGANDQGQLGVLLTAQSQVPTAVAGGLRFVSLAAGSAHSCALTATGRAYCWGANERGQLGDGSRESRMAPVPVGVPGSVRQIAAGWRHTCALAADGAAYCWGDNTSGQLGTPPNAGTPTPGVVPGGHSFQQLAAGNAHTCGLTTAGIVLCWGANASGQLGDGSTGTRHVPEPIDSEERFSAIAVGGVHSCALNQTGAARCWGRNLYGQLGDGTTQDRTSPVPVTGTDRFSQLDAMGSHNCARTPSGTVHCWGYNLDGQIGDGTRENRTSPTPVTGARP